MTLLKESELRKLSSSIIHHYWDGGYKEEYIYRSDNFRIPQEEILSNIIVDAIPSGSYWKNYIGYNSIRIFPVKHSNETYIVLSASTVRKGNYATTPSSYIYLFLLQDFQQIRKQELSWFLKEIYFLLGISSYEFTTISSDLLQVKLLSNKRYKNQNRCFKLKGFRGATPENRMLFEAFFISQFFYNFRNQEILGVSSLCTPQDNTEKFDIFGMFPDEPIRNPALEVSRLSISSSGKINIDRDYRLISTFIQWLSKEYSLAVYLYLILAGILCFSGYQVGFNIARSPAPKELSIYSSGITGNMATNFWYRYIGIRTEHNTKNKNSTNLGKYKGIEFRARGDGKQYRIQLPSLAIKDSDYYSYNFTTNPSWSSYRVRFKDFKQEGFGAVVPIEKALSQVTDIQWQMIDKPDNPLKLEIDDVKFIK